MNRTASVILVLLLLSGTSIAQDAPNETDSAAYTEAYKLLFDSRARAMKARDLLLGKDRQMADLSTRELSLLARSYNELGDGKQQLIVSKEIWKREPGSNEATRWMVNSMLNQYAYSANSQPLFDFVEDALRNGTGNRRALYLLKATALLGQKNGKLSEAEKRVAVADLLVQAYGSGPDLPLTVDHTVEVVDSPNFIDWEHPFDSYFSGSEREAIKVRMRKARSLDDNRKSK